MMINLRNEKIYIAITELNKKEYAIRSLCEFAGIARSSYYKWLNRVETSLMTMNINKSLNKKYNQKRIYRLIHRPHFHIN